MNSIIRDAFSLLESKSLISGKLVSFPTNFASLRYSKSENSIHHQILLSGIVKAEEIIPGGGKSLIQLLNGNDFSPKSHFAVSQPNKSTLFKEIEKLGYPKKIVDLCLTALELAGSDGKVLVEQTFSNEISMELRNGSAFTLQSLMGDCDIKNAKIAIIDGYIESVSEIHHFLSQASDTKEEIFLFIRGCSEEVISTLSVNLKRGSLKIRPIVVKFDEKGLNTLKDIAVVTGATILSSDLGDLISSLDIKNLQSIKRIQVFGKKVYIETSNRKKIIESHFSNLLSRLSSEENELKANLLKQRATCLSSRQVTIRLPDDINYVVLKQSLDSCFRSISYFTRNGISENQTDLKKSLLFKLSETIRDSLSAKTINFD